MLFLPKISAQRYASTNEMLLSLNISKDLFIKSMLHFTDFTSTISGRLRLFLGEELRSFSTLSAWPKESPVKNLIIIFVSRTGSFFIFVRKSLKNVFVGFYIRIFYFGFNRPFKF